MEKSREQSKRRLRNCAERNECQLSRNGDYRSLKQMGGWEGGGGGGRNSDRPTSSLAILMCKGRLFTHVFSRTVLVFFFLYSFSFFYSFNNSDVGSLSERKREQRDLAICQIKNVIFQFLLRLKYLSFLGLIKDLMVRKRI